MKIHSIVDVITNSSSIAYIFPGDDWENGIKNFINKIMSAADLSVCSDDFFEFKLILDEDYAEMAIDNLTKGRYDKSRYGGGGEWSTTVEKEKEIVRQFLTAKGFDIDNFNVDYKGMLLLAEELGAILQEALQNGEIKVDGNDGMFSDKRYTSIEVISKINDSSFIMDSEIEQFMDIEGGNDNY